MKKITTLFICIISLLFTQAQIYKSTQSSTSFNDSLTEIVINFKNGFKLIQGKELAPETGMEVYQSIITLPGTLHCDISRYHSKFDTTASWQGVMYEGDNYEDAVKIYKKTFSLINKSRIKWFDKSIVSFKGQLEKPNENISFSISILQLNVTDAQYKNFVAEIELTSSYSGWEVHLNLHSKKDDTSKY